MMGTIAYIMTNIKDGELVLVFDEWNECTIILSKFYMNFASKCKYHSCRMESRINLAIAGHSDIALLHIPGLPGSSRLLTGDICMSPNT